MALLMVEFLKGRYSHPRNKFVGLSTLISKFLPGTAKFQEKSASNSLKKDGVSKMGNLAKGNKWLEGRCMEDLPSYIFWPAENRYGRVLWWGYGNDGLYFIEKGKGYLYACTKEIFLPAIEADYLDYVQKMVTKLSLS